MNSPGLSLAQFTQLWMCINAGPVHSAVNIIIGSVHSAVNDCYCWPFTGPVHSAVNIIIGPVHSAVNDYYCWPFTGPVHSAVNIITGPVHSAMNIISGPVTLLWMSVTAGLLLAQFTQVCISSLAQVTQLNGCYCWLFTGPIHSAVNIITGPVTQLWMSVIAGLLLAQFTQVWISSLAQFTQLNDCYCWLFTGPVNSAVNIITGPVTQLWMRVIDGLLLAQFTQVWVSSLAQFTQLWMVVIAGCSLAQFTQLWISSLAQSTLLWMIVIAGCSLAQFTQLWMSIIAGLLLAHFTQLWTSTHNGPIHSAVSKYRLWPPHDGPVHSAVSKYWLWPPHNGPVPSAVSALSSTPLEEECGKWMLGVCCEWTPSMAFSSSVQSAVTECPWTAADAYLILWLPDEPLEN